MNLERLSCGRCDEGLDPYGEVVNSSGELYHPECFVCVQCFRPFVDGVFYEFEGRKYCEHDFNVLFAPCCGKCGEFIVGRVLKAMSSTWHPHCFTCQMCHKELADLGFIKNQGRALCHACNDKVKAQGLGKWMCQKCHSFIDDEPLRFKGETFHPYHFNCSFCGSELTSTAREVRARPGYTANELNELYCLRCHDKMGIPICGACHRPIERTRCHCLGRHFERKGLAYCETHYHQLFGNLCYVCNQVIQGDVFTALNKAWCVNHFACSSCDQKMTVKTKFYEVDLKPVCKKCYDKFPRELRLPLMMDDSLSDTQCLNPGLNSSSFPFSLSSNPYGGIPQNILANFVAWTFLIVLFGILRRFAGNYGRLALMRISSPSIDSPWTQVFYPNDLDGDMDEDSGGFYSWLISIFTLSDAKIRSRCGLDAVQYLSFQRHLILFTFFITLICMGVILPINFQGNLQGTKADFGHTTISNLRGDDHRLTTLKTEDGGACISSRTIMLAKVPRSFCTEPKISAYFYRHHSNLEIDKIYIARDVSKLIPLYNKWNRVRLARIYCEVHDKDLLVSHGRLGLSTICCTTSEKAYDYYCSEEKKYFDQLVRCEAIARNSSIGVAFITFKDKTSAQQVNNIYSNFLKKLKNYTRTKYSLENEIKPWKWTIRLAPPPEDIYWENLDYDSHRLFIVKVILVNIALFVFDLLMGHWRRSVENIWIMKKIFFYLLFMVLILPSIGLTSLLAFARLLFYDNAISHPSKLKWNCIFLPDNGAFFVNYVITSALVGTGLELIRFTELFMYAVRMWLAKSIAEVSSVRCANLFEFPFGYNYGWILLIFALTIAYAVVCPLITPFGLFLFDNETWTSALEYPILKMEYIPEEICVLQCPKVMTSCLSMVYRLNALSNKMKTTQCGALTGLAMDIPQAQATFFDCSFALTSFELRVFKIWRHLEMGCLVFSSTDPASSSSNSISYFKSSSGNGQEI
ncbi:LIMS1_2 [Lepeophtheirus salmonis]|uniref:LIMS1_2 n=1 Tax=Lepeophtheirus salmonis TaxID=72036 RepID=A0A7R8CM26_LEPSM|nr:LIMS1_2 [Lepeophtheirus salmonis]CAF2817771.1 LIMS1_2 [Lepeophtheirus salmonis]